MPNVPEELGVTVSTGRELPDRYYQPVEVAHVLGLSQTTVQRLCRSGAIEAKKPGKSWLVTRKEILRYLDEGPRPTHGTSDQSG